MANTNQGNDRPVNIHLYSDINAQMDSGHIIVLTQVQESFKVAKQNKGMKYSG